MKKSKIIITLFVCLMLDFISNEVSAKSNSNSNNNSYTTYRGKHHYDKNHHGGQSNQLGAPLDGGILTLLLGGAGAAYFAIRKRKAKN